MILLGKAMPRRTVLRGGGFALALPWLEAMTPRRAHAAEGPRRFVLFFTENGMVPRAWEPVGGETDFTLSPILKPLEPFRSHLTVLKGLDINGYAGGDGHGSGQVGLSTGRPAVPLTSKGGHVAVYGTGPSIDQYLSSRIGNATWLPSLQVSVSSDIYPETPVRLSYRGAGQPVPPEQNPYKLFARLFGAGNTGADALARLQRKRKSVLDFVRGRLKRMQQTLGAEDAQRLEWHASSVREIEEQLTRKLPEASAACEPPDLGAPIRIPDVKGFGNDFAYVATMKLQLDMLFIALACDMTRIATFEAGGGGHYFFWLGETFRKQHHHDLSHEPDSNLDAVEKLTAINNWYAQQVAYLAAKMKAFREGAGTMLDNVALLWGNQLGRGNSHSLSDAPVFLLGSAGGYFKTGRFLSYPGKVPTNNLLVSIMNAMGLPDTTFGHPEWCTGPLDRMRG